MKRKLNARTITLLSLIGAMICAILAAFAFLNLFDSKSENTQTASAATMPAPTLSTTSVKYSSASQTVALSSTYYVSAVNVPTGWSYSNGTITIPAKADVGTYLITVVALSGSGWTEFGGGQSAYYSFKITPTNVLNISPQTTSVTYSTSAQEIGGFNASAFYGYTSVPSGFQITNGKLIIPASAAVGGYSVVATIYDSYKNSHGFDDSGALTKTVSISINRAGIAVPTLSKTNTTYSTSSQTFTISSVSYMTVGTLPSGWTRSGTTVTIPASTAVGSYSFTVTPDSNHKWSTDNGTGAKTLSISITAKTITADMITLGTTSYTYDGSAKSPTVTVKDGSTTLTKDTHYTVAYSNNTNAGTATVTVTGKGNYTGTPTKTFTINRAGISVPTLSKTSTTYSTSSQTFTISSVSYMTVGTLPTGWTRSSTTVTIPASTAVGSYSFTVTPDSNHKWSTDNSTGAKTLSISIGKASQAALTISGGATVVYGSTLTLTAGGGSGTGAYSWSSSNTGIATVSNGVVTPVKVGTVTITLNRAGDTNYNAATAKTVSITVQPQGIAVPTLAKGAGVDSSATASAQTATTTYNGSAQHFTISSTTNITFGTPTSGATRSGTDFYATNAGTYTVSMSIDADKYCWGSNGGTDTASKTLTLTIGKFNLSNASVTLSPTSYTYDGSAKEPTATVKFSANGATIASTNYGVTYTNNTNAGTATATIAATTGNTNFTGSTTADFTIGKFDLSNAAVTVAEATYTGSALSPTVTVKFSANGSTIASTNYGVTYSNNINAGTATATITATTDNSNFIGSTTADFTINKADYDMSFMTFEDYVADYNGQPHTLRPTIVGGFPEGLSIEGYILSETDGTFIGNVNTVTEAGAYKLTVTFSVEDTDNYNVPEWTINVTINKATPTATVDLPTDASIYYYIGDDLPDFGSLITTQGVGGYFSWNDDKITGENGTYSWTFYPEDSANYKPYTGELEINGAVVKPISLRVTGTVKTNYTAYDTFDTSGIFVTVSYQQGKSSTLIEEGDGGYTLIYPSEGLTYFVLADNGKKLVISYTENGITVTAEIEITVVAKEYDMSGVNLTGLTVTYDGESHEPTLSGGLPDGVTFLYFTYDGEEITGGVTAAGSYEVEAVFEIKDSANYLMPELTGTLVIEKATPTATARVINGPYYAGEDLSTVDLMKVSSSVDGHVEWVDGETKLTTGGSYQWVFIPDDGDNYENYYGELTVEIEYKIDHLVLHGEKTTYDVYESFLTDGVTVEVVYLAEHDPETVNLSDCTIYYPDRTRNYFLAKDDGKDVTIWYGGVKLEVQIHVNKKNVDMSGVKFESKLDEVYDGTDKSLTVENLPAGIEVDYYEYNDTMVEVGGEVINAGEYNVVVYFKVTYDAENVNVPEPKSAKLIIAKATPNVTVAIDYGTYTVGTQLKDVKVICTSDTDGDFAWAVDTTAIRDGGRYDWSFIPKDEDNYKIVEGKISIEIYHPATGITVSNAKTDYEAYDEFDRTQIKVFADFNDGTAPGYVTGWSVTYPDPDRNYFLVEDDGKQVTITYGDRTATVTVHVTKKTVTVPDSVMSDSTVTYDGNSKSIEASNLPEFVRVAYYTYGGVQKDGVTDAGDYEVIAYFESTDPVNVTVLTESVTAQLRINKAPTTATAVLGEGPFYVGYALNTVGIELTSQTVDGTIAWVDGTLILGETGTYDWIFTPDNKNYETFTGTLTVNAVYLFDHLEVSGAKTEYEAYDEFETEGVTVEIVYFGGKTETVEGWTVTYPDGRDHFLAGDEYITISYGEYTAEVAVHVTKKPVELPSDVTITMTDATETYDGTEHSITVDVSGELPAGWKLLGYNYTCNGVTEFKEIGEGVVNAGKYLVEPVFSIPDSDNNRVDVSATLTIEKADTTATAEVDTDKTYYAGESLSTVTFMETDGSVDGHPEIKVPGHFEWVNPDEILVTGGSYQWKFVPDNPNYNEYYDYLTITLDFKVDHLVVHGAKTDYEAYDEFKTDGVTVEVVYLAEKASETYNLSDLAHCSFTYPDPDRNYFLVKDNGGDVTIYCAGISTTVPVTVSMKNVDMDGVKFEDKNVVYNGESKSIVPSGTLPEYVEIDHYTYNGVTRDSVTDADTYEVIVYFKVSDEYTENVAVPAPKTATLVIAQATPDITVEVDYGEYRPGTILAAVALKYECDLEGTLVWTTDGNTVLSDGGSYEWKFTPKNKNYAPVTGNLTVEIYYTVSSIEVTLNRSVYEAYDKLGKDDITVTVTYQDPNKAPATVDGWTVTYPNDKGCFLVDDTDKDVIITYNGLSQAIQVTVNPKAVDITGVEFADKRDEVYTGESKSIVAGTLPDGVEVDYYTYNGERVEIGEGVTNAGTYEVKVYFKVTDKNITINQESKTATLEIAKADAVLSFNGVTEDAAIEFAYKGETIVITTGAKVDNDEQTDFTYTNNTFLNVSDSGVMTITVAESTNYNGATIKVNVTINPAELTLEWTGEKEITYDGRVHKPVLEVSGGVQGNDEITAEALAALIADGTLTVNYEGDCKAMGTYTFSLDTASFPDRTPYNNYTITCEDFTFEITKGELKLSFVGDTEVVYDGEAHWLEVSGLPDESEMKVEYFYYFKGELVNEAINVGEYTVKAVFTPTANSHFDKPEDMEAKLTITPKSIEDEDCGIKVEGVEEEHVYDGTLYKPETITVTVTLNGKELTLVEGTDFTVEAGTSSNGANVGDGGSVIITGIGNYEGTIEITYAIVPRAVEFEYELSEGGYTYDGEAHGIENGHFATLVHEGDVQFTITYTGTLYDGTAYDSTEMPTDAGEYTATVTLKNGPYPNYKFEDAFKELGLEIAFTINKATITVNLTYNDFDENKVYNGMGMPDVTATAAASFNDEIPVYGDFEWAQKSFVLNTSVYNWKFTPKSSNYEIKYGTASFTVLAADVVKLAVDWKDGTQPKIYTSTKLETIRNYLIVTATLENDEIIVIEGYNLISDWFDDVPSTDGKWKLRVTYSGKEAEFDVQYDPVKCDGLIIEDADGKEMKTDYVAFDKFDTSTIKVTATFNDGSIKVLSDTEYEIKYPNGSETLLVADDHITIIYNGQEKFLDVKVSKKAYDTSSWNFPEVKNSTFNGKVQSYDIEGINRDDFFVTYEYYKWNESDKTWTKLTSKDEVKDAGEYRIEAKLTPNGGLEKNYTYPATLESTLTIDKLTPDIGKPGVGGNLSVGTKLSELTLSVEIDGITGTFVWDNEEQELKEGVNICRYTFIPDDPNYTNVRGSIELPAGGTASPGGDLPGSDLPGSEGGIGISTGALVGIIAALAVAVIISIIAIIVACKKRGVSGDDDGFYDDVTDEDLL